MNQQMMRDVARLRELAEQGRRLPLLGGRILILWGAAIALASLVQGAVLMGWIDWPPMAFAGLWAVAMGGAAILGRTGFFAQTRKAGGADLANRLERAVWSTGGAFLALMSIAIFVTAMLRMQAGDGGEFFRMFAMMPPAMFGVYALALRTAAVASDQPSLTPYVWLSLLFAVASVALGWSAAQFVLMGLGALVVSVLPGMALIRLEGRSVG